MSSSSQDDEALLQAPWRMKQSGDHIWLMKYLPHPSKPGYLFLATDLERILFEPLISSAVLYRLEEIRSDLNIELEDGEGDMKSQMEYVLRRLGELWDDEETRLEVKEHDYHDAVFQFSNKSFTWQFYTSEIKGRQPLSILSRHLISPLVSALTHDDTPTPSSSSSLTVQDILRSLGTVPRIITTSPSSLSTSASPSKTSPEKKSQIIVQKNGKKKTEVPSDDQGEKKTSGRTKADLSIRSKEESVSPNSSPHKHKRRHVSPRTTSPKISKARKEKTVSPPSKTKKKRMVSPPADYPNRVLDAESDDSEEYEPDQEGSESSRSIHKTLEDEEKEDDDGEVEVNDDESDRSTRLTRQNKSKQVGKFFENSKRTKQTSHPRLHDKTRHGVENEGRKGEPKLETGKGHGIIKGTAKSVENEINREGDKEGDKEDEVAKKVESKKRDREAEEEILLEKRREEMKRRMAQGGGGGRLGIRRGR
ncbi:hypothetical protein TREMEDRAFT_63006 [Tremella mesenterica DSM 1558]|uniref:uncharacterized protein n=1 Tax=Tremella mesenterica (strain ATCC 24925 / CBS 8224 / DSM 1558 / NBRC 9311 / NRRL Y-6157 / RJB 2259-6 / UBC 559-6) TaxID=578456 RepID=UPI0003F49B92|nr:uncharacterized protein TREMEDRAFT_63006 [Tremella mesenterica DSM 1558]EIW68540.1 hypothetical protein TREMEDRAFT_63006 [Tremella mesenterica DSM 1558]